MANKLKYDNEEMIENLDAMSKEFLDIKKHNYCRDHFFPHIINQLGLKTGAEIGVDKGGFSNHILSKTKIEQYYCIDTWQDDFGSDHRPDYFDKEGQNRYLEAEETLIEFINEDRVEMMRMTSAEASKVIDDDSLDFCYIDGDHSLHGIFTDFECWVPKVKVGGIVAGHDYKDGKKSGMPDYFGGQLDYKIKTVVDDLCMKYGYPLRTVGGRIISWYFIKNH
jgi:hypothetical protein